MWKNLTLANPIHVLVVLFGFSFEKTGVSLSEFSLSWQTLSFGRFLHPLPPLFNPSLDPPLFTDPPTLPLFTDPPTLPLFTPPLPPPFPPPPPPRVCRCSPTVPNRWKLWGLTGSAPQLRSGPGFRKGSESVHTVDGPNPAQLKNKMK